jgi:uncharacterized protein YjbI with pentapeptide repeats
MSNAILMTAKLINTDLSETYLNGANLSGTDLEKSDLNKADLDRVINLEYTQKFHLLTTYSKKEENQTNNPWGIINLNIDNLPAGPRQMMKKWQEENKQKS